MFLAKLEFGPGIVLEVLEVPRNELLNFFRAQLDGYLDFLEVLPIGEESQFGLIGLLTVV